MTNNYPGERSRVLGALRAVDGRGVVRIEDRLDAGIEQVWSALTDPDRLSVWLGQIEGDLRLGGEIRARFYASGWEGSGRVDACVPQQRLRVATKDADETQETSIEITLTAEVDRTLVVWEEDGKPLELLAAYGAGIQIHVEDLVDHVAGRTRRDPGARFDELFLVYKKLPVAGA
jgi:uncharacterized protein YndB with AHSA1/START domain